MPGCKTTIFASITGEVGALANSQFRVNSFLPTLYWYVDQDGIGIGIENDIDSGMSLTGCSSESLRYPTLPTTSIRSHVWLCSVNLDH